MAGPELEARGLFFPIKLRCSAASDLLTEPDLEDALTRALGRAFARANAALPAALARSGGVSLGPPELVGGDIGAADASALLALVSRAIGRAAAEQALPLARGRAPQPGAAGRAPGRSAVAQGPQPVAASATREPYRPAAPPAPAEPLAEATVGVSEGLDPLRIDPVAGTYTVPSYDGGTAKVPVRGGGGPFRGILDLHQQISEAAWELIKSLKILQVRPGWRNNLEVRLVKDRDDWLYDRTVFVHIADVHAGKEKPGEVPPDLKATYDTFRSHYSEKGWGFPVGRRIAVREDQLRGNLLLYNIVRAQVAELDRLANAAAADRNDQLHDVLGVIAKFYLELILLTTTVSTKLDWLERKDKLQRQKFARLSFLVTFYGDPARAAAYAVAAYAKEKLPSLEEKLRKVYVSPNYYYGGPVLMKTITGFRLTQSPGAQKALRSGSEHLVAAISAVDRYQFIRSLVDGIGDPPGRSEDVTQVPSVSLAQTVAAAITHLQVEVAVLALWAPLADVRSLLLAHHIEMEPFRNRLEDLEYKFAAEVKKYPHPTIEEDYVGWHERVTSLLKDVSSTAFWTEVKRAAAGSIPFLVLAPLAAEAAGVWVAETISSARWVIALGRAAAVTLVSIALHPPTNLTAGTAWGLAIELGLNSLTEGLGQIFQRAAKAAETSLGIRRAFLRLVSQPAVSFGMTTSSITAAQAIESRARHQGGETSLTELLTVNLILNGLGMLVGAALHWPPGAARGGAITAPELVDYNRERGVWLSPDEAKLLLEVRARSLAYDKGFRRMAEVARQGTLTPAEFEATIDDGKALAQELKGKLPGLAKALKLGVTSAEIEAALDERIALLDYLKKVGLKTPLRALPELTTGLNPTALAHVWTYDPTSPPRQLEEVLHGYIEPGSGNEVRGIPGGGGWEVVNRQQGQVVFQALSAGPRVAGLLSRSLTDFARTEQTRAGLDVVRAQGTVPQLESLLVAAAARPKPPGAPRTPPVEQLLRVVGNFIDPSDTLSLRGLNVYLSLDGNPWNLARALTFRDSKEDAAGNRLHVQNVLYKMAVWDKSAVRGFEALFRIRPGFATRSDNRGSLEGLFGSLDLNADQIRGTFQAIGFLEARSENLGALVGSLASSNPSNVKGAVGALTSAVMLVEAHPGAHAAFEVIEFTAGGQPRKQDIVLFDPQTRVRLKRFESKEIYTTTFGRPVRRELAVDIVLDSQRRHAATAPSGPPALFSTFIWRVRANELAAAAAKDLGIAEPREPNGTLKPDVEARMREILKDKLKDAFNLWEMGEISKDEAFEYRKAFDQGLPFVEFI